MTSTVDELDARGFAARPDNQAIFMRAKRHSRLVRLLRLLVPVGTAVVLAGITLMSWLDPMRILARLPTAQGQLVISGTKITMEAPKLAGFTKDGRGYELNARAAAQDITKPDIVELHDIRAKIEAQDRTPINLTAVDGLFDRKSGILKLAKDVMLTTPSYRDQSRGSHRRHYDEQRGVEQAGAGEDAARRRQLQASRSRQRRRSRALSRRREDDAGEHA